MNDFLAFIITALLINLTPGPAMLFCINQSQNYGVKSGVLAAFGVESGVFVYVIATAFGLGIFFDKYPNFFKGIQILGMGYLIYLAYQSWPKKKSLLSEESVAQKNRGNNFLKGLFINLTNPKIGVFFISLMPQFVSQNQANSRFTFLFYGLVFNLGGLFVNTGAALMARKFYYLIQDRRISWMMYIPSILFVAIVFRELFKFFI